VNRKQDESKTHMQIKPTTTEDFEVKQRSRIKSSVKHKNRHSNQRYSTR